MSFGLIKRALISVTNKTGIVEFAQALESEFGVEIISTGGTARVLKEAGVKVIPIEMYTGFPEMMDGRVKTLHPRVHGGLLCRRDNCDHLADAQAHDIGMIDLVCVNLYEFEKTVEDPHVTFADAIEHIDIGGPSMLRSAAKNNDFVTVVSDPADYSAVLTEMRKNDGATTRETRRRLALKVFQTTAAYDGAIAAYLSGVITTGKEEGSEVAVESTEKFPRIFTIEATKEQDLRYGENPQQSAAFYRLPNASEHSLARAQQIQGKPLSYNNLLDTDAAWTAVREFSEPAVIILKHQNPCGSAVAENIVEAYDRAFSCDPTSAFGGIIAANREISLEFVEHFADIQKLRVLATGGITHGGGLEVRTVDGGLLVQDLDLACEDAKTFSVPTKRQPTSDELDDLLFAWKVCKTVKSNAILVAKDRMGLGMGPGQPNRVDAALLACERAEQACERRGIAAAGLVAASDAFFPFRDNVDTLAAHGVTAIIQPGGSVRDEESIEACNEHDIAMVFTGVRHFRH